MSPINLGHYSHMGQVVHIPGWEPLLSQKNIFQTILLFFLCLFQLFPDSRMIQKWYKFKDSLNMRPADGEKSDWEKIQPHITC